jgi:hypothetical protein
MNSQWINPSGNGQQGFGQYDYTYETTFNLPGAPTPYTSITGQFATDDVAIIMLNGVQVGTGGIGKYNAWTPLSITSGFQSGMNTLDFVILNRTGGPSGVDIQLSGVYAPEPASLALVGAGLLGAGFLVRRRRSS